MKRNSFRIGISFLMLAVLLLPPSDSLLVDAEAASAVTPQAGRWTGVTNRSQPMSFTVRSSGNQLEKFKLKMTFSNFFCTAWVEVTAPGPTSIMSGRFSESGGEGGFLGWTFSFTGTFDSPYSAHGTYTYNDPMPSGACLTLSQSGTWTASVSGGPPPSGSARCLGMPATIVGTSAGDTLNGTAGDDVIVGLGGSDTINGRGGNDRICGNGGNDTIFGGPGADMIKGGSGADNIMGGGGNDTLFGNGGNDTLTGNTGYDMLTGGWGFDACSGEAEQSCEM